MIYESLFISIKNNVNSEESFQGPESLGTYANSSHTCTQRLLNSISSPPFAKRRPGIVLKGTINRRYRY